MWRIDVHQLVSGADPTRTWALRRTLFFRDGQERHFPPHLAMSVHTPISDMMARHGKRRDVPITDIAVPDNPNCCYVQVNFRTRPSSRPRERMIPGAYQSCYL